MIVNGGRLSGAFILLSGSASRSCPAEKLSLAHDAVRNVTLAVLREEGGLIVFASGEPLASGGAGLPLVFDWTALRALEVFLDEGGLLRSSRVRAIVVTSSKGITRMMSADNRELLKRLSGRRAVDLVYVDDDLHTGGNIRDAQIERAAAMVALGGGKGVADIAVKLIRRGKPVLPLDMTVGALSEDGEGAVALHRRLCAETKVFFPETHVSFRGRIPSISLEVGSADPLAVASEVVDAIAVERAAAIIATPQIAILTALPVELAAAKVALGLVECHPAALDSGTQYWRCSIRGVGGEPVGLVLSCIGAPGNVDAASAASEMVDAFRPRLVLMVGIAAGIRGKIRLGEVVISERIVAYESAAVLASPGSVEEPRPEQFRPKHSILQLMTRYLAGGTPLSERLAAKMASSGVPQPTGPAKEDVAEGLPIRSSTLASGEKLIRDPERLRRMKANLHGKIEVAEMEAAGIARACDRANTAYLVFRGISDFGDGGKDDRAHGLAATAAAIVAVDFVEHAYEHSD